MKRIATGLYTGKLSNGKSYTIAKHGFKLWKLKLADSLMQFTASNKKSLIEILTRIDNEIREDEVKAND